jgi:glutathione S-transferase
VARCSAITASGARCRGVPVRGSDLCAAHHPETQARRRAGARRGGKARGVAEISDVKGRLRELAESVLEERLDRADAAVISQVWNVYLRAVATEIKVRELEELEERMEALEEAHAASNGATAWRA